MARGFITDTIIIGPAFPIPHRSERVAMQAYRKYVTRAEKKLYTVKCGSEEFIFTVPEGLSRQMLLFHQEMLRYRVHRALDALPTSTYLFCDDDASASSVPKTATFGDLDVVLAVDHNGEKVEGFTDMEVTSDLLLLFGDRREEPVQITAPEITAEVPPPDEDLTIP